MNKKVGMMAVLMAVGILGLLVPAGYARERGRMEKHDGGLEEMFFHKAHMILAHKDELKLSKEQAEKIKTLKLETKKTLIMKEAEIETVKLDLKAKLHEDAIDTKGANALIDRKYDLKKAKAKTVVGALAELKGILSDEQKEALKGLWREKKKDFRG